MSAINTREKRREFPLTLHKILEGETKSKLNVGNFTSKSQPKSWSLKISKPPFGIILNSWNECVYSDKETMFPYIKQTNDKVSLVWGFASCCWALKPTCCLKAGSKSPLVFNTELLCNTHLAIFTAVMGSFYFLIMYWQHVPSYNRNNSGSIWETLFPFLITNTVELHFIIPQTFLFMMHINLGICY